MLPLNKFSKNFCFTSYNAGTPNDLNKFTGHERDQEGGLDLDYMLARNYDGEIGMFYGIDALSFKNNSVSPYSNVMNNPLMIVDPTGMDTVYYNKNGFEIFRKVSDTDVAYTGDYNENGEIVDWALINGNGSDWENYMNGMASGSITFKDGVDRFGIRSDLAKWVGSIAGSGNKFTISDGLNKNRNSHADGLSLDIGIINGELTRIKAGGMTDNARSLIGLLYSTRPSTANQIIAPNFLYNLQYGSGRIIKDTGVWWGYYPSLFSTLPIDKLQKVEDLYNEHVHHIHISVK